MMGRAADIPLITSHAPRLSPHLRCHAPLVVRKRILWPDESTTIADEPCWSSIGAAERLDTLDALYRARGYTVLFDGDGWTCATSAANTVTYWLEDMR